MNMECPQCGSMVSESSEEEGHYTCSCGCSFDYTVCFHCGLTMALEMLEDDCPNCGCNLFEDEDILVSLVAV